MVCQQHQIVNPESVTKENRAFVHTSLLALQILSDESDKTQNHEGGNAIRERYWSVKRGLSNIGVNVEFIFG